MYEKFLCVLESKYNDDICKADFCVTIKPAASAVGYCQESNIRNGAVRRTFLTAHRWSHKDCTANANPKLNSSSHSTLFLATSL